MSDFTAYTEGVIADLMSQGTNATAPSNLYVALHTSDPGDTPDGSTEVSAGDYSRVSTATGTDWNKSGSSPTTFSNASEITFGQASSNWGTVTHVSLWDTSDNTGNCWAAYDITSSGSNDVTSGVEPNFNAGQLSFDID